MARGPRDYEAGNPTLTRELRLFGTGIHTTNFFWQPTLTRELRLQKKRKMCGDERTEILLKTGQQSLLGGQALKSVPSSFTAAAFQKKRHKWQLGTCPVPLRRCANRLTFPCMLVLRT